ncbi:hypothetical protein BLNAU_13979 [Blattamonas nauphoetae]|uniref:Uncharacterized protein n=1 Tax=Blattamonas nauphoetae TaxID=2049346 RepID=A0ABQ9XGL5_9EUKA|nr:hypothetical protein BLNAU_13979 [Blattamonas nauphoetae]
MLTPKDLNRSNVGWDPAPELATTLAAYPFIIYQPRRNEKNKPTDSSDDSDVDESHLIAMSETVQQTHRSAAERHAHLYPDWVLREEFWNKMETKHSNTPTAESYGRF